MAALKRFNFHVADEPPDSPAASSRGMRSEQPEDAEIDPGFTSAEAAARFHLSRLLAGDSRPGVRGITAPERAGRVPDLHVTDTQQLPGTSTTLLRFELTQHGIPIFGAQTVCELTEGLGFVSASGQVGRVEGVSAFPSVSQERARASIARFADVDEEALSDIDPAKLNFFEDDKDRWHLVWLFERVPAAPPDMIESAQGHGHLGLPRTRRPLVNYLVDAHSAEVVYRYSATPLLNAPEPIPVRGDGISEDGVNETVWGQMAGAEFELNDPSRDISTYDLAHGDVHQAALTNPYRAATSNLGSGCKAVVSAHVNATKVYDFLTSVLQRDGIDNAGMELINVVNCTNPAMEAPPVWHNAAWDEDRMLYGQAPDDNGTLVSFARFLDVMAHELTHGVTQFTSDLEYRDQAGALNESFSDIFGIIVKNWDASSPGGGDVATWDWELGSGLGGNGLPLRDLRDPTLTGDPAHMNDYVTTSDDEGGVHTNSNIHNKAAYNVLTATDDTGQRVFTPREVALLYYLTLVRLLPRDGFTETLRALESVATTMYAGNTPVRDANIAAIQEAYAAVGIT